MAVVSPFLKGNWEPVSQETADSVPLQVQFGNIPADLSGCFLRIGPNPSRPEKVDHRTYHFFFADGMVHGVEFAGGSAKYRSRYVQTPQYLHGKDVVEDTQERGGVANTAVVFHAGRLLCLSEASKPWNLALPSLATVERFTYSGGLRHNFTAHPKVCASTGEMVFFGYGMHTVEGSSAFIHCSVASADGRLLSTLPVNFRRPVMTHDMAITAKHTILGDFPLWDMRGPTKEEDRSRFGIFPRHSTSEAQIQWFDAPGQYAYHTANAWERPGSNDRVVDLVMVSARGFSFSRSNASALKLTKWAFDLDSGKTLEERVLSDVPVEFPIVDSRVVGLPTRYIWTARLNAKIQEPLASDGLVRFDLASGEVKQITLPDGRRGGEPQFVPRRLPGGGRSAEGDGYLILFTHVPGADTSDLCVFDALTMSPDPLAIVAIPSRVPYGFHALWVDVEKYQSNPQARL